MNKDILIDEIASFGFNYGLFNDQIEIEEIKKRIGYMLEDSEFLENLINTIILKARYYKNIDMDKLKKLLIDLEKTRLELEYKSPERESQKC